jgi:hypothetical protein
MAGSLINFCNVIYIVVLIHLDAGLNFYCTYVIGDKHGYTFKKATNQLGQMFSAWEERARTIQSISGIFSFYRKPEPESRSTRTAVLRVQTE